MSTVTVSLVRNRRNLVVNNMLNSKTHSRASAFEHCAAETAETCDICKQLRLVVIRSDRLQRLEALNAPEIVLRNERRMLRAAVAAAIENAGKQYPSSELATATRVDPSDLGKNNSDKSRR